VSALTGSDWNADRGASAAEMARAAGFEEAPSRQKLAAFRDTLIVLSMQIVFRVTMFLRHLNY
jgi:hypothetical protein